MKFYIFLLLIFLSCTTETSISDLDISNLKMDSSKTVSKTEFFSVSNEIFSSENKFCDINFGNQSILISGDSYSAYVVSEKNPMLALKYNLYKSNDSSLTYILTTNCCPADVCHFSKIFSKVENKLIFKADIVGEVLSYDQKTYKIIDHSITGLVYLFSTKSNEVISIFNKHPVSIPSSNSQRSLTVIEKKEINILKRPTEANSDNLYRRVFLNPNQKIFVLHESIDHDYFFIYFASDKKSIDDILNIFEDDAESYINKVQALKTKIKSKNDFRKLLEKKFFQFGWVERKHFE